MTQEEISEYERQWRDIISALRRSPRAAADFNNAKERFRELAATVGASEYAPGGESDASISHFSHNIQQALQTASMIDVCRTAAENVTLAKNAQASASRAQQVAFWSMLAAWGAVVVNIVVAYIMVAGS